MMNAFLIRVLTFGAVFTAGIFFFSSCNDSNTVNDAKTNFDRTIMLQNFADNFIKPSFSTLSISVDVLNSSIEKFVAQPTTSNLLEAQKAWELSYLNYQSCNVYNFGPGEISVFGTLNENIAVFPVNTIKIEDRINTNNLSFDNFDRDTRGFLGLEYLLYSKNTNESIVALYVGSNKSRGEYLKKTATDIKSKVKDGEAGWKTYASDFVKNNGTDAGSATSMLYNEFIKSYEGIKNFKVLLPAGKRAGQTSPEPTKVEAFYSGKSILFLKAHLKNIQNLWSGNPSETQNGVGFEEYLLSTTGGEALVKSTKEQLQVINAQLAAFDSNAKLSDLVISQNSNVEALGTELQKNTRFFKSDMSSLLGIAITFSSGDGD